MFNNLFQYRRPQIASFLFSLIFISSSAVTFAAGPNDPYFKSKGSWGESYDDQWAIKRIGFTADGKSAWNKINKDAKPVVVAVVDTGLDWNHKDIDWGRIWRNEDEIPDNGIDDDNNGYVDDVIGWDFWRNNSDPWDRDGHGTFVAGVIAATQNNGVGIAGINPNAQIMVLKAMNTFGHTRASQVARAIIYAADNGARIINLSLGGKGTAKPAQLAIDYAHEKGVLVIVAAGNEATNTDEFGPANAQNVITVGATDPKDKKAVFSNWGSAVDIAAPGVDVLSLRARRTDMLRDIPDVEYPAGKAFVGEDKRYYVAGGTSFAAPLVAGVASLLLSNNPGLTNAQVERMLLNSAQDVDAPGVDQFTGYGLVDANAALNADPEFFIQSQIDKVGVVQHNGKQLVQVTGTVDANDFKSARIELGAGESPDDWNTVVEIDKAVQNAVIGNIPAQNFAGAPKWIIRVVTEHANGKTRETRFLLKLG